MTVFQWKNLQAAHLFPAQDGIPWCAGWFKQRRISPAATEETIHLLLLLGNALNSPAFCLICSRLYHPGSHRFRPGSHCFHPGGGRIYFTTPKRFLFLVPCSFRLPPSYPVSAASSWSWASLT